ncbi:mucin-5AC [Musca vetustissima]|uniref:mucin-5AC n=1 Tax=Musca vetustissima TaxID=27455 RepID=UPI002AB5F2F7|nr:mucin-5AC [Musca vetustissima]
MSQLGTVYATKRRRRNGKSLKPPPKDGVTKSNPSKRHRERLNAELDLLASLLPFEQNILSKLDRLSILRLSVSYLRTKSYFQVVMHKEKEENGGNSVLPHIHAHDGYRTRELGAFEHGLLDGDMFLQALNGFLMILTCDGEVFFATHSIESYLGFHQSDIVHQSVYELVHSEDREELQRQLLWNSFLPADMSSMQLAETLAPDKALYLERSFTVRFRCLLDNTSGFLRLDIRGRIKILHGQNRKTEEPPLALFAYCTPFGPPSLLEIPHKENMFKSKHKLDFSLVSMDQRGKHILGYSDAELVNMGGYDLVHYDDLAYVASAHQELLKTGASGMIAYRYQKKDGEWQWLQTSSRLVYKNSKPDFVICTHRVLMDEEGFDLLGKRTMDFKVSYLDTGLASTYFSEADQLVVPPSGSPNSLPPPVTPTRPNRRYKTQLRDFLSTCRSKRKMQQQNQQGSPLGQVTSPAPVVEYLPDPAAAVAAAYSNLNPMYTTSPYATAADNIYMGTSVHSTNFYPVTENLFHQYRLQGVGGYYADYHHSAAPASAYVAANGFLSYDGYAITSKEEKWQDTGKYYSGYSSGYGSPTSTPQQVPLKTPKSSPHVMEVVSCSSNGPSPVSGAIVNNLNNPHSGSTSNGPAVITPKVEMASQDQYERQTVLMWGSQSSGIPINTIQASSTNSATNHRHLSSNTERSPQTTPLSNGLSYANDPSEATAKWNGSASKDNKSASTPDSYQMHHDDSGLYSASSHTTSPQHRLSSSGSSSGGAGSGGSTLAHNTVAESSLSSNTTTTAPHTHNNTIHSKIVSGNTTTAAAAAPPPPHAPLATATVSDGSTSSSTLQQTNSHTHLQNTVHQHHTSPSSHPAHPHHHHHHLHANHGATAHAHSQQPSQSHSAAVSPHHHHQQQQQQHHSHSAHHHHHHHPHAAHHPHHHHHHHAAGTVVASNPTATTLSSAAAAAAATTAATNGSEVWSPAASYATQYASQYFSYHPHHHHHPSHHHHHHAAVHHPLHAGSGSISSTAAPTSLSAPPPPTTALATHPQPTHISSSTHSDADTDYPKHPLSTTGSLSIMISQQSQQQQQPHQQQVLQLSPYNHHLQPLVTLAGSSVVNCNNAIITSGAAAAVAASASSSPSCSSPPLQQLPAISSVINGLNGGNGPSTIISSNHNGSLSSPGLTMTSTATPYHQLAIIASPIVITSTTLDNPTDLGSQGGVSLQSLGTSGTLYPSSYKTRNATTTAVMHPSASAAALAYATNAYVIGAGPGPTSCAATATLSGLEQNIDGSPLLSFSEVTNTLLNQ